MRLARALPSWTVRFFCGSLTVARSAVGWAHIHESPPAASRIKAATAGVMFRSPETSFVAGSAAPARTASRLATASLFIGRPVAVFKARIRSGATAWPASSATENSRVKIFPRTTEMPRRRAHMLTAASSSVSSVRAIRISGIVNGAMAPPSAAPSPAPSPAPSLAPAPTKA